MARDINRRVLFDTIADLYGEARPGYPAIMVEEIVRISGIPPGGRVLEIGPGAGQATLAFAARGYDVLALELGANLTAKARQNLAAYPNAYVMNMAFENWPVEPEAFDLVISGSAWHWIPPEIGYERAAQALKPSGYLALFWNGDARPQGAIYSAVSEAYARNAPEMTRRATPQELNTADSVVGEREKEIIDSGFFEPPSIRAYPWSRELSSDDYVKLCCTYSDHISLPEEQRNALCQGIRDAIDAHGGSIERQYMTRLYIAQRSRQQNPIQ